MKIKSMIALFLLSTFFSCSVKEKKHINSSMVETTKLNVSNEINFELIKEWVKDKRVVSIGESTHGLGEFYSFKAELIPYLHKELGFEIVAMEGGFADINLAWIDIDDLSATALRNKTLFGNFNCKEIEPLFKYIKENAKSQNPLIYTGFDTEISGDYYEALVDSICTHLNLDINVKKEFTAYFKMYQASTGADSINFIKYKTSYQSILTRIKNEITNNKEALQKEMQLSELELGIILRNLENQHKIVDYNYSERLNNENMQQGIVNRDKLMSENLKWIIETLYLDKKIIIWAHNGHVAKGGINSHATKMMGHHLKEMYADKYFTIGLFAYKGKTYQHWTKRSIAFENSDSTSLEYKMKRENFKYTYQKFGNKNMDNWTNKELSAFEIENGGHVTFIPSDRFDAAINIYSGDIPTFYNQK